MSNLKKTHGKSTPKPAPVPEVGENVAEQEFSDADIANILTEEDLRARSHALNEAQETWEEVAYLANPKMPCPECSGAGAVPGGSLGDICVRCMGARVIEQPGRQSVNQPPFAELRAAITEYATALADRRLPAGHRAKQHLALPAAETVPSLEDLRTLTKVAIDTARQLQGAPGVVDDKLLAAPQKAKGLAGEGDLNEYTDAELDGMENDK